MSYQAIITAIRTRPHPNAQRLQLGTCLGNQVVVGMDTKDGQLGVFFPTDGQLSHEYCVANDLYTASARNRLNLAPSDSPGYLDHNRRVRAQRFRQERSDGLWMPLTSLSWTGSDPLSLREGDSFTELGGYQVCNKYYTPAPLRALGGAKLARRDAKCFPKHDDTKQFRFVADAIPEDAVIYITEKLHGTSGRYGRVWDSYYDQLPWYRKLLVQIGVQPCAGWIYLNGSKNVILERSEGSGWYGTNDFRYNVVEGLDLHKGEVLYFEIVGWVAPDRPIMPPHNIARTKLEDVRDTFGDSIHYTYGCPNGEHRIYVYKIINVNEDGVARELPWNQLVARCGELGVAHVPLHLGPVTLNQLNYMQEGGLRKTVEMLTDGRSALNFDQIREGVVIRVESRIGISHIKNKSHTFGVLEGYIKEDDSYVDIEEVS